MENDDVSLLRINADRTRFTADELLDVVVYIVRDVRLHGVSLLSIIEDVAPVSNRCTHECSVLVT